MSHYQPVFQTGYQTPQRAYTPPAPSPVRRTTPPNVAPMSGTGVTTETVTITPQMAEKMLGSNTHNRRLDMKRAREMARDMEHGKWQMNGDTIRFSKNGVLLHGQTRLTACVLSGKPFTTLVVRGLDNDTQLTMDTGKPRTMSDVLTLSEETNPSMLAAVVRGVYMTDQLGLEAFVASNIRPTNTELAEFLNGMPQLRVIAQQAQAFKSQSKGLLSPAMFAALWWALSHKDHRACEEFFHQLATGAGLAEGDPILVLRNTIFGLRGAGRASTKEGRRTLVAITVKAWNKWRAGKKIKQLRFGTDETFPVPR